MSSISNQQHIRAHFIRSLYDAGVQSPGNINCPRDLDRAGTARIIEKFFLAADESSPALKLIANATSPTSYSNVFAIEAAAMSFVVGFTPESGH